MPIGKRRSFERLLFAMNLLLCCRIGCGGAAGRSRFELLALFFGALLQLLLQLLLVLFELLRIGRRTVIGLGAVGKRQRQRDRLVVGADRLNDEVLTLLHVGEQFGGHFVIGHAAVLEADHVG